MDKDATGPMPAGVPANENDRAGSPAGEPGVATRFLGSEEGRIFLLGCCMIVLWFATIAALLHTENRLWSRILSMGFAHMLAGRAASIAHGTQAGVPSQVIAMLATYFDVMVLFIVFPALVFSYKHFCARRFFKRHMEPVFVAAQKKVTRLRRFKIVGVFLFVWFPLWMTGITMGAVLGFLLGLKMWVNMTTVVLGSASAVICWVYAYDKLYSWGGHVHKGIPTVLTVLVVVALVCYRITVLRREFRG